jgi:hypothetical protein
MNRKDGAAKYIVPQIAAEVDPCSRGVRVLENEYM